MDLVDVGEVCPKIVVELRYSTENNFTGKQIYDFDRCLLLEEVAEALGRAQQELEAEGLGLKVWDGYRPLSAQWKLWEETPDRAYVADPRKGGKHTRGTAVDCTLVGPDGRELEMPSGFDEFSESAHLNYIGGAAEALTNRARLQGAMQNQGFQTIPREWWHFDFEGWEKFPVLSF